MGVREERELGCKGHEETFGGNQYVHYTCTYAKARQTAYFKYVQFIVCQLYLDKTVRGESFLKINRYRKETKIPIEKWKDLSSQ